MDQPRRRGRPRKEPVEGDRVTLGLRVTAQTKKRLDEAADASGRSQSQEAEIRIERSFDRQELLGEALELAYGAPLAQLLRAIGWAMATAGPLAAAEAIEGGSRAERWLGAKENWPAINEARNEAAEAAIALLRWFQHGQDAEEPASPLAKEIALTMLTEIEHDGTGRWAALKDAIKPMEEKS